MTAEGVAHIQGGAQLEGHHRAKGFGSKDPLGQQGGRRLAGLPEGVGTQILDGGPEPTAIAHPVHGGNGFEGAAIGGRLHHHKHRQLGRRSRAATTNHQGKGHQPFVPPPHGYRLRRA
ncbi:MAG: hypothetical protein HC918_12140 [Oscillatoriales cyanobacterium SM2_1_8]|nr:hypothetical protein [Oscillatoriales cyanobacterium SM2_1_8]